uniref:M23ase beta-sheet core domain-containing protein n=1 Tax=candidate division WOR-3 bacterium TaxID=2052148 RepID=A0A7C4XFE0_UNCW3
MEIIFIYGKRNRSEQFEIKPGILLIALGIVLAVLIIFIYGLFNFTSREIDRTRLGQLTKENRILAQEMIKIQKDVDSLHSLMDSLEKVNIQIKSFAPLEPIEEVLLVKDDTLNFRKEKTVSDIPQISKEIDKILLWAKKQGRSSEELVKQLKEKDYLKNRIPSIAPINGWFLRGFGYRLDPFTGMMLMHEGIDIVAPAGTPIVAPADGVVKSVDNQVGFGLTITIDHGYGYSTFYAHCQQVNVEPGQIVKRGDVIGFVGNTGKSTGPHLHYEIRISDVPVDPLNYILGNR